MASIKDQLLSAEEAFISALSGGEDAVVAFNARWETLVTEVDSMASSTDLDDEISALCHTVAMRIYVLADISAELTTTCDTHTSLLMGQLDDLMFKLSLEDESPQKPVTFSLATSTRKRRHSSSRPVVSKRQRILTEVTTPIDKSLSVPHPSIASPATITSRKRRHSDANVDGASSHPSKRLYVGPRLHAVSDSYVSLLLPVTSIDPSVELGETTSPSSSPLLDIQPFDVSQLDFIPHSSVGPHDGLSDPALFPTTPLALSDLDDFIQSLGSESFDVEPPLPSLCCPDDASFLDGTDALFPGGLPVTPKLYTGPSSPSSSCPNTPPPKPSPEITLDFPSTFGIPRTICHPLLLDDFGCGASIPGITIAPGVTSSEDMNLLLAPIDPSMCYLHPPKPISTSNATARDDPFDVFHHPPGDSTFSTEFKVSGSDVFESGTFHHTLVPCC